MNCCQYCYGTNKERKREEKNLLEILTNYGGLTTIKASYQQFGPRKKRKKRKQKYIRLELYIYSILGTIIINQLPSTQATTKFYYHPCVLEHFG
ncbi:hypothetical protein G9A89_013800 [Geosiphon pyriformis]|nr:hypothetical protein G9A89_013800 [Geosiphon pyriformis]